MNKPKHMANTFFLTLNPCIFKSQNVFLSLWTGAFLGLVWCEEQNRKNSRAQRGRRNGKVEKMEQQINGKAIPVEDLGFSLSLTPNENKYQQTSMPSLSAAAVRMMPWMWADVNSIVMNSSIDSEHHYHYSLWSWSFIVICYEGRAASAKHRYPSAFTAAGMEHISCSFIHSFICPKRVLFGPQHQSSH